MILLRVLMNICKVSPFKIAHYGSYGGKHRYLSGLLSVKQMYELYLEKNEPENYLLLKSGEIDTHKLKAGMKYTFIGSTIDETTAIHLVIPN
jgi:hypothetical protein